MNEWIGKALQIEQYQCRSCGRLFYIDPIDRSSLDLDFGCPYGCDDNGRHIRNIEAEVKKVTDVPQRQVNEGDD